MHKRLWACLPLYMLGDTGNKRAVRILLECILVHFLVILFVHKSYNVYNKTAYGPGATQ